MRHHISPVLGLIDVVLAAALFLLGLALPARDDVRRGFDGARRVTSAAGDQVLTLREQVGKVSEDDARPKSARVDYFDGPDDAIPGPFPRRSVGRHFGGIDSVAAGR